MSSAIPYAPDIGQEGRKHVALTNGTTILGLRAGGSSVAVRAPDLGASERAQLIEWVNASVPAASSHRDDQAVTFRSIMHAVASMRFAINDVSSKIQYLKGLRVSRRSALWAFGTPGSFLVGALGTIALCGMILTPIVGLAAVGALAALWAGVKVFLHTPKIAKVDIEELIALRDAAPEGDTRTLLTKMLYDFANDVFWDDRLSEGARALLSVVRKSNVRVSVGSPAGLAALGLLKMATGNSTGNYEIFCALENTTPGRERARLSRAIREYAFSGDACLLPISESKQVHLAQQLLQSSETS